MPDDRPLLYDLFSGAGGAGFGYQQAGFRVIGIDNRPQPRYPCDGFIQMDAFDFFDAVERGEYPLPDLWHASPPCQAHSIGKNIWKHRLPDDRHPELIEQTRARLKASGVPWIIENVVGAPLKNYVTLCGDMFGLGVKRHRLFETNFYLWCPSRCRPQHPDFFVSVFGGGARARKTGRGFPKTNIVHARASEAMGIDWMTRDELSEAIPPAYTRFIGEQALRILQHKRSAA